MRRRTELSALTLAAVLGLVGPAGAGHLVDAGRSPGPPAVTDEGPPLTARQPALTGERPGIADAPGAATGGEPAQRLAGRVVDIDPDEGRFVLRTPLGIIALHGSPDVLKQLSVGDEIVVELLEDD
jgi:hypothetical protein